MKNNKLLNVDDEPDICDLISDILSESGYSVNSAFSKDEISFYLDKILPKFEFEHHFVDELIKKKRFEKSYQIQELFEERYFVWLEKNFPNDFSKFMKEDNEKSKKDFVRTRSLSIMARLVELGIFVKEPGKKFGPYYVREK